MVERAGRVEMEGLAVLDGETDVEGFVCTPGCNYQG